MDTKDEEPDKQAWARETSHAGNTRFFTNGAAARARPLPRLSMLVQKPRGPGPMERFQGAAILPTSRRGSLVLIIYLVLTGYLELKRRTPTTLVFHFISCPVIPRLPNKGSSRHSHFAACLPHGPGCDPHGAAVRGHWRPLKARDSGSGLSWGGKS